MKYIDADKLLSEIERRKAPFKKDIEDGVYPTYLCALLDFEDLISSLQQEQQIGEEYAFEIGKHTHILRVGSQSDIDSLIRQEKQEQPDMDFEKELKNERTKLLDVFGPMSGEQSLAVKNFARHFVELGLNARKEE